MTGHKTLGVEMSQMMMVFVTMMMRELTDWLADNANVCCRLLLLVE